MSTPYQPVPESEPVPRSEAPPPILPREAPAFGFLDLLLILVGGFFILLISQFAALGIARALPRFSALPITELAKQPLVIIPAQVVSYILLIGFIHLLLIARYDRGLADLIPFRWPPVNLFALLGTGVGLALTINLLERYLPIPKQLPIDDYFKERSVAFIMLGFGVLIAPFVEELLFRGLIYPVLNRAAGAVVSVIVTSILFALLHAGQLAFSWAPLLALFLVGVVLTLVRARFQSVTASTLVHMAYNATLFGFLLAVTGGFRHMDALTR